MTVALVGLAAQSAPGLAAELDHGSITAHVLALPVINPGAPISVPAPALPAPALPADEQVTEAARFETLADAVAAQDVDAADDALRCLAGAVFFESQGEPIQGQLAVAEVIINRAKSGRFPSDVCGVVTQRGQFSFVRGGEIPSINTSRAAYRTALAVAKVALADAWNSPAAKALYFHARGAGIGGRMTRVAAIGNHVFFR